MKPVEKDAFKRVEDASARLSDVLREAFKNDVRSVSRRVKSPVTGIIAMGRYFIENDDTGHEFDTRSISLIDKAVSEFNLYPYPIRIRAYQGRITSKEDDW